MISNKLLDVDSKKGLAYLLVVSALVVPGVLYFYLFNLPLFLELDFSKLFLAAFALSVPPFLLFLSVVFSFSIFEKENIETMDYVALLMLASILAVTSFFLAVMIWWLTLKLKINHLEGFLVYWYLASILVGMVVFLLEKKEEK